jgi:hypothetical protein
MFNRSGELETISNAKERTSLRARCQQMIESSALLSKTFLNIHKWIAVPVESALHFNDSDAQTISKAILQVGIKCAFAIATENVEESISYFKVPMSSEGLLAFSKQCSHFNYIICPSNEFFAILCTVDDYFLVAGPESFVVDATGMSVSDAYRAFRDFASNSDWPRETRLRLLTVSDTYGPK